MRDTIGQSIHHLAVKCDRLFFMFFDDFFFSEKLVELNLKI